MQVRSGKSVERSLHRWWFIPLNFPPRACGIDKAKDNPLLSRIVAVDPLAGLVVDDRLAHGLREAQVLLKACPDLSAAGVIKGAFGNDGCLRLQQPRR